MATHATVTSFVYGDAEDNWNAYELDQLDAMEHAMWKAVEEHLRDEEAQQEQEQEDQEVHTEDEEEEDQEDIVYDPDPYEEGLWAARLSYWSSTR